MNDSIVYLEFFRALKITLGNKYGSVLFPPGKQYKAIFAFSLKMFGRSNGEGIKKMYSLSLCYRKLEIVLIAMADGLSVSPPSRGFKHHPAYHFYHCHCLIPSFLLGSNSFLFYHILILKKLHHSSTSSAHKQTAYELDWEVFAASFQTLLLELLKRTYVILTL
jgi:hypothetical protein